MIVKRYYGGWHSTGTREGGVKGFIGWSRVEQHLKTTGEIKEDEQVVVFDLSDPDGITYTVEKIEDSI